MEIVSCLYCLWHGNASLASTLLLLYCRSMDAGVYLCSMAVWQNGKPHI